MLRKRRSDELDQNRVAVSSPSNGIRPTPSPRSAARHLYPLPSAPSRIQLSEDTSLFHARLPRCLERTIARDTNDFISNFAYTIPLHLARFLNFLDPDFLVPERNETKRNHVRVGLEVKAWWGKGGGITKRVNRADRCTTAAVTTSSVRLC